MKNPINNLYDFLGRNKNSATIISCLIAVFKGTFRPIFTMTDKSQDPKTKKYAAIREGVTEVAALPLYAATPTLAGMLVKKFYNGAFSDRVETNSKFLGVCLATTLIPFVCNWIQPGITKMIKNHEAKKNPQLNNPVAPPQYQQNPVNPVGKPQVSNVAFSAVKMNYGMKVGG